MCSCGLSIRLFENEISIRVYFRVTKSCLLFSLFYNLQMIGVLPISIQEIALGQAVWLSTIMVG